MKQWTPQMKHKKEERVIESISKQLKASGREFYNTVIKWVGVTVNPIYSQWI